MWGTLAQWGVYKCTLYRHAHCAIMCGSKAHASSTVNQFLVAVDPAIGIGWDSVTAASTSRGN